MTIAVRVLCCDQTDLTLENGATGHLVTVKDHTGATVASGTVTSADGRISLTVHVADTYTVTATQTGWQTVSTAVTASVCGNTYNVYLKPRPPITAYFLPNGFGEANSWAGVTIAITGDLTGTQTSGYITSGSSPIAFTWTGDDYTACPPTVTVTLTPDAGCKAVAYSFSESWSPKCAYFSGSVAIFFAFLPDTTVSSNHHDYPCGRWYPKTFTFTDTIVGTVTFTYNTDGQTLSGTYSSLGNCTTHSRTVACSGGGTSYCSRQWTATWTYTGNAIQQIECSKSLQCIGNQAGSTATHYLLLTVGNSSSASAVTIERDFHSGRSKLTCAGSTPCQAQYIDDGNTGVCGGFDAFTVSGGPASSCDPYSFSGSYSNHYFSTDAGCTPNQVPYYSMATSGSWTLTE